MGLSYTIDEARGLVQMTWEGHVPIVDWAHVMDQIQADPRFKRGFVFLSDRRGVTTAPTADEIRLSVDYFEKYSHQLGRTKWAVLTTPGAADYGMMRMGQIRAGELIILEYFDSVESAERWLLDRDSSSFS